MYAPTSRELPKGEIDAARWALIGASVIGVAVCAIPVSILAFSVFIKPLSAQFGWGRGPISLGLAILQLAMAAAMPIAGRAIDRYGVRGPLVASLLAYAAGVALFPAAMDRYGLTGFYVVAAWIGVTGSASSQVAYVKILSRWFDKSRGLALGFAMSGIALGGAVTPSLAASLIQAHGWRAGFYGLAALPVVIGIPIALLLKEAPAAHADAPPPTHGASAAEASRQWVFWALFGMFFLSAASNHGIQLHLAAFLSDRGLSPPLAATGVSFMFAVSALARLVAGYSFDRFFAPRVGAVCFLAAFVGAVLLIPKSGATVYFIAAALCGAGAGAESDLLAMLISRYFGLRSFATIYGWVFAAFMTGGALGPYLLGAAFDATGDYTAGFLVSAAGLAIVTLLLMRLPRFPKAPGAPD